MKKAIWNDEQLKVLGRRKNIHSSIKMKPKQASVKLNENKVFKNIKNKLKERKPKYK